MAAPVITSARLKIVHTLAENRVDATVTVAVRFEGGYVRRYLAGASDAFKLECGLFGNDPEPPGIPAGMFNDRLFTYPAKTLRRGDFPADAQWNLVTKEYTFAIDIPESTLNEDPGNKKDEIKGYLVLRNLVLEEDTGSTSSRKTKWTNQVDGWFGD